MTFPFYFRAVDTHAGRLTLHTGPPTTVARPGRTLGSGTVSCAADVPFTPPSPTGSARPDCAVEFCVNRRLWSTTGQERCDVKSAKSITTNISRGGRVNRPDEEGEGASGHVNGPRVPRAATVCPRRFASQARVTTVLSTFGQ